VKNSALKCVLIALITIVAGDTLQLVGRSLPTHHYRRTSRLTLITPIHQVLSLYRHHRRRHHLSKLLACGMAKTLHSKGLGDKRRMRTTPQLVCTLARLQQDIQSHLDMDTLATD
jgi:hypothetical protein